MKSLKTLLFFFGILLISKSSLSQCLNNEVVKANMVVNWERAKAYTKEYIDAMPDEAINFKPMPDIRSFSEQMLHMSQGTIGMITSGTGAEPIFPEKVLEKMDTYKNKITL